MKQPNSTKGGLLVGKTDRDGGEGIKVQAPEGQIIMGGGEVIINEEAAKTHCEELSEINQSTGGVAIPCDLQKEANHGPGKMEEGGKLNNGKKLNNITYYMESEELNKGIKIEKEHKNLYKELQDRLEAKGTKMPMTEDEFFTWIAKAHLNEKSDYYTLLNKYIETNDKNTHTTDSDMEEKKHDLKANAVNHEHKNILGATTLSWVTTNDGRHFYKVFEGEKNHEEVYDFYKNKGITVTHTIIDVITHTSKTRDLSAIKSYVEKLVKEQFSADINPDTLFIPYTDHGDNGFTVNSFEFELLDGSKVKYDSENQSLTKLMKKGGQITSNSQRWLKEKYENTLKELKAEREKIQEEMPDNFKETTGGSGRTKSEILSDFDNYIKDLELKTKEWFSENKKEEGGKIKEYSLPNTNLYLYGRDKDSNGNTIVKIGYPNRKAFSIQTNGVLPETHHILKIAHQELSEDELSVIEKEIADYISEHGSKIQKSSLKKYKNFGKFPDGMKMAKGGKVEKYYCVVSITKDDYWVVITTPCTKEQAEESASSEYGTVRGEKKAVKTVTEVLAHNKVLGKEYLQEKKANGGKLFGPQDLPKDGSPIHVHMPKLGSFPEEDIILKYNPKNFYFDAYRNGEKAATRIGEKQILDNLNHGLYELKNKKVAGGVLTTDVQPTFEQGSEEIHGLMSASKGGSIKSMFKYWDGMPLKAKEDYAEFLGNRKKMWNKKEMDLTKAELNELKQYQIYIHKNHPEFSHYLTNQPVNMEKGGNINSLCPTGTVIQTLIFDKKVFSKKKASEWLKDHDFKSRIEITEDSYRARQIQPRSFKPTSLKTTDFDGKLPEGLKVVIGCLRANVKIK